MIDLKELDQLPKRESRKEYLTRKYGDMWDIPKFDHPWYCSDKNDTVSFKLRNTLKKFLGKPFDKAFSYFCSIVPKYEQKQFLEEFIEDPRFKRWHYYGNDYTLDDEGNIILNPERYIHKRKSELTLKSVDYQEGWYNKSTKRIVSDEEYRKNRWKYDRSEYDKKYIRVIVKGYEKTFESKDCKEYKRMKTELVKAKRLNAKAWKKYERYKQVCFLTREEKEKEKEKALDIINRDRHGFDENSFIGK